MLLSASSRLASSALLAVVLLTLGAGAASAHVSVDAGGARPGADDALLTFRVPNERSGARTVEVVISFPTRTPVGSVKPAAKPGWTATTERVTYETPITTVDGEITQGVGTVVFRAASPQGGIPEDSFDTFQVLVGPLPAEVSTLAFPTLQKYSNGDVSSWIQPTTPGSEPDHPAPVLALAPAGTAGTPGTAGPASAVDRAAIEDEVRTARLIALLGVGTGALGLVTAGVAIGRTRRLASAAAPAVDRSLT